MKTIIAGSRGITDFKIVQKAVIAAPWKLSEIVSGGARGVDTLGGQVGDVMMLPVKTFLPDWRKYNKSAGYIRNVEMAEYADALIAIWDGKSNGTAHMIKIAYSKKLKVYVYNILKQGEDYNEVKTAWGTKLEPDFRAGDVYDQTHNDYNDEEKGK